MTLPDNSLFCCYCGQKFNSLNKARLKTADHLIPLSKGGANNPYNKRNCCKFCNTQKADLLLQDFLLKVKSRSENEYEKSVKIENIEYLIEYVNTAGQKIFKNEKFFNWYKRRYLKITNSER